MELRSEKYPGGACPQTSQETCAFDARLENRSAVILDQPVPHILDDVTHRDVVSFKVISQCVAASLLL